MSVDGPTRWQRLAEKDAVSGHVHPSLGRYKSGQFCRLVRRWVPSLEGIRLLKTDLREEAFGTDEVLFSLLEPGERAAVCGMDIAALTTRRARQEACRRGLAHHYVTADVRALPFDRGSFDLILSNSTLDHFEDTADLGRSLRELSRVLAPGGRMILTLNNGDNLALRWLWKAEQLARGGGYPVRFYRPLEVVALLGQEGLQVLRQDVIIHVPALANSTLRVAARSLPGRHVDTLAGGVLGLSDLLDRCPLTRRRTGWFIALECAPLLPPS